MRVIAGIARSMPLKAAEGDNTRPTTDRIKETLFNMLQSDIAGCRFLDLYSGSGAIGIEALSRGAKEAVLVENARKARVITGDCVAAIDSLERSGLVFDIIFMDPPYGKDYEYDVLLALSHSDIVDRYTIIVIEEALNVPLDYIDECGFETVKIKNYKTNKHIFIRLKESE